MYFHLNYTHCVAYCTEGEAASFSNPRSPLGRSPFLDSRSGFPTGQAVVALAPRSASSSLRVSGREQDQRDVLAAPQRSRVQVSALHIIKRIESEGVGGVGGRGCREWQMGQRWIGKVNILHPSPGGGKGAGPKRGGALCADALCLIRVAPNSNRVG